MRYSKVYKLNDSLKRDINRFLTTEPRNANEMFMENDHISISSRYLNGKFIVVELCGCADFKVGESNLPWTQAILYSENGHELVVSDVEEKFCKEWQLVDGEDVYILNVI